MFSSHSTYLWINILTLFFPLILSFDSKVRFYKKWIYLFPSLLFTAFIFIIWDIGKTALGVWSFNNFYLSGTYLVNLPMEEWLFFFTVPYACMFIYECLKVYFKDYLEKVGFYLFIITAIVLALTTLFHTDRIYTVITFPLASAFTLIHLFIFGKRLAGRFWAAYIIHFVPFFVVNGLLTGLPVVEYNDLENMQIRLFTIPIEDTVYSYLLLLMNVTIYERLQLR